MKSLILLLFIFVTFSCKAPEEQKAQIILYEQTGKIDTSEFEIKIDTIKLTNTTPEDSSDQWQKDSLAAAAQGYYGC